MEATIEAVSGGSRVVLPMVQEDDGWARAAPSGLASGLYRVEIAAAGENRARFLPVHSLFEIAAATEP